ncbi:MAG: DNA/RNA nuclease SfsA [Clostridia bacterium]|nr:DNA/RNA nuclease SfsA [Clostridia bacterium]
MKYGKTVEAIFLSRPNRFIAEVLIDNIKTTVHVKNTGRCRELLTEGAKVILEDFEGRMGTRKMRYDLISVYKGDVLFNMDSQAPNKVVKEALERGNIELEGFGQLKVIRPEMTYSESRFDFYIEDTNGRKGFIEVKGVTLEEKGIASFPDAKTERGRKHVNELVKAREEGYSAYILFVIQMEGMKEVRPNIMHDPEFSDALINASEKGVNVIAYSCLVGNDTLEIDKRLKVNLNI